MVMPRRVSQALSRMTIARTRARWVAGSPAGHGEMTMALKGKMEKMKMSDGAEIGVGGNAARKFLAAVRFDADFAQQFHFDAEEIVLSFAPADALSVHGIDEGRHAVRSDADGNQPADRPEFGEIRTAGFCNGGDRGA